MIRSRGIVNKKNALPSESAPPQRLPLFVRADVGAGQPSIPHIFSIPHSTDIIMLYFHTGIEG